MASTDVNVIVLPRISHLAYCPVDSENGEIRLVELAPSQDEDPFHFTIYTKRPDEKIEYEALSYAWGAEKCVRRVLVDGVPLPITENLDRALRRLRYPDCYRMLWIDTLCINQADVHENSHQVRTWSRSINLRKKSLYGLANGQTRAVWTPRTAWLNFSACSTETTETNPVMTPL